MGFSRLCPTWEFPNQGALKVTVENESEVLSPPKMGQCFA